MIGVALAVLVGCGSEREGTPAVRVADVPDAVDVGDPDSVARWVLAQTYGWEPAHDTNRNDAMRRAFPLLADEYRAVLDSGNNADPGADWRRWADLRAVADVTVEQSAEIAPASDAGTAYRSYVVHVTMLTGDGRVVGAHNAVVQVVLSRVDAGWRVAHMRLL